MEGDREMLEEKLTTADVWDKYDKARNKVEILWQALDYMSQYNGRSKITCIAMAMGYETDGDGTYFK